MSELQRQNTIVSIIVPVYNSARSIEQCVESITNQTYKDLEIILVDDSSDDGSYELCMTLAEADSRIRIISNNADGVSSARNAGLRAASGAYIAFADSDDVLEPDMIEKLAGQFASHPDCDISTCGYFIDHIKTRVVNGGPRALDTGREAAKKVIRGGDDSPSGYVWNKMFKASFLESMNASFREDISVCEDLLFTCTVMRYARLVSHIQEPLYHYKVNSGSVMSVIGPQRLYELKVRDLLFELYSDDEQILDIISYVQVTQSILLSERFKLAGDKVSSKASLAASRPYISRALTNNSVTMGQRIKLLAKLICPALTRFYIKKEMRWKS